MKRKLLLILGITTVLGSAGLVLLVMGVGLLLAAGRQFQRKVIAV